MAIRKTIKKDHKKSVLIEITTDDGLQYDIPPEGSLGLLAAGYKGILLWREKRNKYLKEKKQESNSNE